MVDEKDLGVRPEHEALTALADKIDRAKAAFRKEAASTIAEAENRVRAGDYETAALIFEEIGREAAEADLMAEARAWRGRASDARTAARHRKRRKVAGQ